jgi:hypothetical protein
MEKYVVVSLGVSYIGAVSVAPAVSAEASYPGGEVALLWEDENAVTFSDFEDKDWRYPSVFMDMTFVLVGIDKDSR